MNNPYKYFDFASIVMFLLLGVLTLGCVISLFQDRRVDDLLMENAELKLELHNMSGAIQELENQLNQ